MGEGSDELETTPTVAGRAAGWLTPERRVIVGWGRRAACRAGAGGAAPGRRSRAGNALAWRASNGVWAHYYAAQAVELLPDPDRAEYRRRVRELLLATRGEDGTWNDRIFQQSAAYGTSVAVLSMMMPETQVPARWQSDE